MLDDSWVVVDVETGGLNPRVDPLLGIGAVRVTHSAIAMAPSCEVQLRQLEATASDNILVHGRLAGSIRIKPEIRRRKKAPGGYSGGSIECGRNLSGRLRLPR